MDLIFDIPGWEGKYSLTLDGRIWSHFSNAFLKQVDDPDGYLFVTMRKNGKQYAPRTHRLMALAFLGSPEEGQCIDHIDRNKHNNAANNLRWCTNSQNQHNTIKWKTNRSGFKGVILNSDGRWSASIKVKDKTDNKQKYLGSYKTPEEAARAYDKAARELAGEFARTNFAA